MRSLATSARKRPLLFASAALAALSLLSGFVFDYTQNIQGAGYALTALFALLAFAAIYLAATKKLTPARALALLVAAGFLLRVMYILCHTVTQRQHDVGTFLGDDCHAGYILHFYKNGLVLPSGDPRDTWSFYNPPLWHALAGLWMRLNTALGLPFDRACENIQCLSLACSSLCMTASLGIFRRFSLKGWPLALAGGLVCLHPTFFMLAGSVNNDVLCLLLQLAAFCAALAWYDRTTFARILASALCVGLSMLAKTSGVLVAPAMALLFLARFIQDRKTRLGGTLAQFAAFGAVSLPIGLWWSVRGLVKFGMPLGYVPRLPEDVDQYVGSVSAFKRFFVPQLKSCFISISGTNDYMATGFETAEYNIPAALLKTSLFGEYTYAELGSKGYYLDWALFIVNALLAAGALAAMAALIVRALRKGTDRSRVGSLALFWLTGIVMFTKFCFEYPHTCTMDFRYVAQTCVIGALCLGLWLQQRPDRSSALENGARAGLVALSAAFGELSAAAYMYICVFTSATAPRMLCAVCVAVVIAAAVAAACRQKRAQVN